MVVMGDVGNKGNLLVLFADYNRGRCYLLTLFGADFTDYAVFVIGLKDLSWH